MKARGITNEIAAILLYAALVLIIDFLLCPNLDTAYLSNSPQDSAYFIWLTDKINKFGFESTLSLFNKHGFYSLHYALVSGDNFIIPAYLNGFFSTITKNSVFSFNLTIVIAQILNGYLFFKLIHYLCKDSKISLLGGLAFMLLPYLWSHLNYPQLQFSFIFPYLFLSSLLFLEKRSFQAAVAIALGLTFSFLTSIFYLLASLLIIFLLFLGYFFLKGWNFKVKELGVFFLTNLLILFTLALITKPYLYSLKEIPLPGVERIRGFSSNFIAYLSAPSMNLLWGETTSSLSYYEAQFFVGFIIFLLFFFTFISPVLSFPKQLVFKKLSWSYSFLLLITIVSIFICAFLRHYSSSPRSYVFFDFIPLWLLTILSLSILISSQIKNKREKTLEGLSLSKEEKFYLFIFLFSFFAFLSLGLPTKNSSLWSLYGTLTYSYPEISNYLIPSRFGIVASLCLITIALLTLNELLKILEQKKQRFLIPTCFVLAGLIIFELFPRGRMELTVESAPGVYRYLANLPQSEGVIALPILNSGFGKIGQKDNELKYLLWSREFNQALVNGYSSTESSEYENLVQELLNFPDQKSIKALRKIPGLNYIIYHPSRDLFYEPNKFQQIVHEQEPRLQLPNLGESEKFPEKQEELALLYRDKEGNFLFTFKRESPIGPFAQ